METVMRIDIEPDTKKFALIGHEDSLIVATSHNKSVSFWGCDGKLIDKISVGSTIVDLCGTYTRAFIVCSQEIHVWANKKTFVIPLPVIADAACSRDDVYPFICIKTRSGHLLLNTEKNRLIDAKFEDVPPTNIQSVGTRKIEIKSTIFYGSIEKVFASDIVNVSQHRDYVFVYTADNKLNIFKI